MSRRQRVLDLAADLLGQHGFKNLHLEDLAVVACMAKPQLYQLFDSKDALYVAVLERELRRLERAFDVADDQNRGVATRCSCAEAARQVLRLLFAHHERYPRCVPLLFGATDWRQEGEIHRHAVRRLCRRINQALRLRSCVPLCARHRLILGRTLATAAVSNLLLASEGVVSGSEAWDLSVAAADVCVGMGATPRASG